MTPEEIRALVAPLKPRIEELDQETMMEVVGVAQALGGLRKALDNVDACLNNRTFEQASNLGYKDVSSEYVFLQRVLGGLQSLVMKKQVIVQEVAFQARCAYEEVEPFVDEIMQSSQQRKA